MYNAILKGFEYKLDIKYINMIEKEFKINLGNKKNMDSELFFENFYKSMNSKLLNNKIYKKIYIDKKYFVFKNFNKKVWIYNFYIYLKNNKDILYKIKNIKKSNKNINNIKKDLIEILGENFKYDINKILTIM